MTKHDLLLILEGLPDDAPVLVQSDGNGVIDDPLIDVRDVTIATEHGVDCYYWFGEVDEEEIREEGYEPADSRKVKALVINGDHP
jgi:hypothetical protein